MRIVIAEDEPVFRQMLATMLTRLGYEPLLAADGNEALAALTAADAPQLAILDWLMPGVDGAEVCRRIRETKQEPYTYLILLTGKNEQEDLVAGMEAGADDYLVKPVRADELRVRLNAGRRIVQLQNQLRVALDKEAEHAADLEAINVSLEGFSYAVSSIILRSLQTIASSAKEIQELVCPHAEDRCRITTKRIYDKTKSLGETISLMHSFLKPLRRELRRQETDLSRLAFEVCDRLRSLQPQRRVAILITEGLSAYCDRDLLQVVLENLLMNAWRFTEAQEEAVIEFGKIDPAGETFFVRDNGLGFDQAYARKLFMPFYRAPGTERFSGSGVGLATAERIIRRHGGTMWAESTPGRGATFYFTLPAKHPGVKSAPTKVSSP